MGRKGLTNVDNVDDYVSKFFVHLATIIYQQWRAFLYLALYFFSEACLFGLEPLLMTIRP